MLYFRLINNYRINNKINNMINNNNNNNKSNIIYLKEKYYNDKNLYNNKILM